MVFNINVTLYFAVCSEELYHAIEDGTRGYFSAPSVMSRHVCFVNTPSVISRHDYYIIVPCMISLKNVYVIVLSIRLCN